MGYVALETPELHIERVLLRVYDNSRFGEPPRLVLQTEQGRIVRVAEYPMWLQSTVGWTCTRLAEERVRMPTTP